MMIFTSPLPISTDPSPAASRAPLLALPAGKTTSPTPTKAVRRRASGLLQADSSEEAPSSHASIYEAFYFSTNNSDESISKRITSSPDSATARALPGLVENNENLRESPQHTLSIDDKSFLYGRGTHLETIAEQRSYATMRSIARTKSAEDIATNFLRHRDSFFISKSPRRKTSFSLDDMALINRSYHEACATIEEEARKETKIAEVYAQPKMPVLAPLLRPGTPPGMPSWTAAQTLPRQPVGALPTPNRVQRFFRITPSPVDWRSRNASSNGHESPTPIAPRFRPTRSAYGAMTRHPFNSPPISKRDPFPNPLQSSSGEISRVPVSTGLRRVGQAVRFTGTPPSAQELDALELQQALDASRHTAPHPLGQSTYSPEGAAPHTKKTAKVCRHKSRGGMLRRPSLNQEAVPPSNEYVALPMMAPLQRLGASPELRHYTHRTPSGHHISSVSTRADSLASYMDPSRNSTPLPQTSTTQLLAASTLLTPRPTTAPSTSEAASDGDTREKDCWRCRIAAWLETVRNWLKQAGRDVCDFLLVGGLDEDHRFAAAAYGGVDANGDGDGDGDGPRRVVLRETPIVF